MKTPIIKLNNGTWLRRALIHSAVGFFSKILGFKRRLRIEISLINKLKQKEHCRGMAHQNSRNGYHIKLDAGLKPLALIRCLAHEMIHVNQWVTGKMEDINNRYQVRWGEKLYRSQLAYTKHPWEIEAYKYDKILANKFIAFYKGK